MLTAVDMCTVNWRVWELDAYSRCPRNNTFCYPFGLLDLFLSEIGGEVVPGIHLMGINSD